MQSRFPFSGFAYNLQNKTWSRIEDFLRSAPDVYLYKGTFNPYHEGHQFALDIGLSRSSASALVISADSVGKDLFKADPFNFDPALRIEQLSNSVQIGWLLFMPDLKLFNETKQTLLLRAERSNTKLKSLNFIMGDDTLKRVVDMKDFDTLVEGCKLFVIKRSPSAEIPAEVLSHKNVTYVEDNPYPEISSTKIREKAGI
jgi:nicotinic acid mononucleotide adenylyltransferase